MPVRAAWEGYPVSRPNCADARRPSTTPRGAPVGSASSLPNEVRPPSSGTGSPQAAEARRLSTAETVGPKSPPGAATVPGSADPSARPRPADLRHRYTLGDTIGEGGMGVVISAFDKHLGRMVAIKLARNSQGGLDEESIRRFLGEAQITGQLEHPNIVPVHELGEDLEGNLYFAMKRIDGITLARLVDEVRTTGPEGRNYTLTRVLHVILKVCEAISFAHSRGVIHRDLKPSNVMIGSFGEVLVVDWGLAKAAGTADTPPPAEDALRAARTAAASASPRERDAARTPPEGTPAAAAGARASTERAPERIEDRDAPGKAARPLRDSTERAPAPASNHADPPATGAGDPPANREVHRSAIGGRSSSSGSVHVVPHAVTQVGTIMGTLEYMPPEQALGHVASLDQRSDVYAIGALLYEVLTLRPPFEAPQDRELVRRILQGELVPPSRRTREAAAQRAASPTQVAQTQVGAARVPAPAAPAAGEAIGTDTSSAPTDPFPGLEVPPELDAIVLKAMAVKPENRYATVESLRQDLLCFLEGMPISAYSEPFVRRVAKWMRRHPTILATSLTAAALLLVGGAIAFTVLRAQERERIQLLETKVAAEQRAAGEARLRMDALEEQRRRSEARARAYEAYQKAIDASTNRRPGRTPLAFLEEAVQLDPTFVEARSFLGGEYNDMGRPKEAVEAWRECSRIAGELGHHEQQARFLYWIGRTLQDRLGDARAALETYRELARVAPENVYGRIGQGFAFAMLGDMKAALEQALKARDLEPDFWEVHQILGYLYGQPNIRIAGPPNPLHDPARAIEELSRAIELKDDEASLWSNRATLYTNLNQYDKVAPDLERALKLSPRDPSGWILMGALRRQQRRYEEALTAYGRALALDPARIEANFNRGYVYLQLGRLEEALADYDRFVGVHPDNQSGRGRRAVVRLRLGDLPGAQEDLDVSIRSGQESEGSFHAAATCCVEAGHADLGLVYASRGLAVHPDSLHLRRLSAECRLRLGDEAGAVEDLDALAERTKQAAGDYLQIGRIAYDLQAWRIAARYLDQGLALDRDHVELQFYRAGCAYSLEDYETSIALFSRILATRPDDLESMIYRGAALRENGDFDASQRDLDAAAARSAVGSEAQFQRGLLRAKRGQVDLAREDFDRCLLADANHVRAMYHRGLLRLEHGEPKEGEADVRRSAALGYRDALWTLVELHERRAELDEARALLETIAKRWPALRPLVDPRLERLGKGK